MAVIQVRVDDKLKDDVTKVFEDLDMSLMDGIRLYLRMAVVDNAVPVELALQEQEYNSRNYNDVLYKIHRNKGIRKPKEITERETVETYKEKEVKFLKDIVVENDSDE